jgi:hypothetical protein
MKRSCAGSVAATLLFLLPGTDPLRHYVGEVRFLRGKADERSLTIKPQQRLAGDCDMAMRVRDARFVGEGARFSLETVGRPRVGGREPRCRDIQTGMQLVLAGLSAAAPDVGARVDAVLLTPEGYLRSHGIAFDRAPAEPPREVASPDASGPPAESLLGRKVTVWPKVLLAVSPYFHDLSGRVRQESEVEFDAVVGADGRLYQPRLKTSLNPAHQEHVLSALSRWRYEPARTADGPVAARLSSRLAFRIY